jgi:basic membrane protein A
MRMTTRAGRVAVAAACIALAAAGCTTPGADDPAYTAATSTPRPATGEPDLNGDGKVVIGVLSPGNLHDHGYYESFVDKAQAFTKQKGWKLIEVGPVKAVDAANQARNLCRQGVDMVALGAAELKDALPASNDAVCAKAAWYVPSNADIVQTSKITISEDFVTETLLAAGYANGLLMRDRGVTKAGFVTGPQLDFSLAAASAFQAGMRTVLKNATLLTAYTGSFDDSLKAKIAAQAQITEGVKVLYPYLGGATDAVAKLGNTKNLILSPGTDRCDSTSPRFDVAVIFDPGEYFAAALADFANGDLKMGVTRQWHLGKDTVPTVKLCNGTDAENAELGQFIANIGSGAINPNDVVKRLGIQAASQ